MIAIPEQSDITDLQNQIEAICRHMKIKLIIYTGTTGYKYKAVTDWPFQGGIPVEPLHGPKLK